MRAVRPEHQKAQRRGGVLVEKTSRVKVTMGKIRAEGFQNAYDEGRAAKYQIDADWEI